MVKAKKLAGLRRRALWSGNVLRTKGSWPYEDWVDFMVYRTLSDEMPFGFIVTSGYKSGSILVHLPKEAALPKEEGGLSRKWVVDNWK